MPTLPMTFAAISRLLDWLSGVERSPGVLNAPSRIGLLALAVAREEIGRGESVSNNHGPDVAKYCRGRQGEPWCAWFVSWCMAEAATQAGLELPFRPTGGAKKLYSRIGATGYFIPDDLVQPGDIACWSRGVANAATGHVGIVSRIIGGVKFSTIEGNKGAFPSYVDEYEHVRGEGGLIGFARCKE